MKAMNMYGAFGKRHFDLGTSHSGLVNIVVGASILCSASGVSIVSLAVDKD